MDLSLSPFGADLLVEWVDKVRGGFGEGFLLGGNYAANISDILITDLTVWR